MLITPATLQALQTSFSTIFGAAFKRRTTPLKDRLAMTVSSTTKTSTYGWMSPLFAMRKWIGPRVVQNLRANTYMIENDPYEATMAVDRDNIEDDQLGLFNTRVEELAYVGSRLPDQLILEALNNGASTTLGLGFDGLANFSASHTLDPAGVQSNLVAANLTPAGWAFVRSTMQSFTGENGEPLGVNPNLVVIPPEYEFAAKHIFKSALTHGGGTNVQAGEAEYLVVPELAGTTDWYAFDTSQPIKPFIFQLRKPVQLVSKTAVTDDNVFWQKEFVWGVDGRAGVGYGPWFLGIKSTGAAGAVTQPPTGGTAEWSLPGGTA
jgi:phage major head subunit gpT-like protein